MTSTLAAPPGRARALLLVIGTGLAAAAGAETALPPLRHLVAAVTRAWQRGDAAPLAVLAPDTVLAGLCAAALLTALAVWSLGVVVTLVEVVALPGRARFTLPCPALVRALRASPSACCSRSSKRASRRSSQCMSPTVAGSGRPVNASVVRTPVDKRLTSPMSEV